MRKIFKLLIVIPALLIVFTMVGINMNNISLDGIFKLTEITILHKLSSFFIISYVLIRVYFELSSDKKYDMKSLQVTLLIVTSSLMLIYNVINYDHTTTQGLKIALTYRMTSILGMLYIFEYYIVSFVDISKRFFIAAILLFCLILLFMFSLSNIPILAVVYYGITICYILVMMFQWEFERNLLNNVRFGVMLLAVCSLINDLFVMIYGHGSELTFIAATIMITAIYLVKGYKRCKDVNSKLDENRVLKMKVERLELLNSESEKALNRIKLDLNSEFTRKQHYYDALEMVVDNLKTNVIVINQDFKIELAYGEAFGYEELGNQDIKKVFSSVFQDDCQFFISVLNKIFNAVDEVRETLFVSLLDTSLNINNQMYDISYYVTLNNERKKVLIMHAEIQAFDPKVNQENHDQAVYNMITAVVRNSEMFYSDLESFNQFIEQQLTYLNNDYSLEANIFKILRKVHTYKGVFDQYNMQTTVRAIDDIENELFNILHNNEILSLEQFKTLLIGYDMKQLIQTDLLLLKEHLGKEFFNYNKKIGVDFGTLNRVYVQSCELLGEDHNLSQSIQALKQINVLEVLNSYESYVLRLASELGKQVKYTVTGEDLFVSRKQFIGLFEALIHILKNSVAHGIEYPDERRFLEKDTVATINCHISMESNHLILKIVDDGRGIDIKEIKNKLFILGKYDIEELEHISDDEICNMVIEDGVTSYAKPTDIAGRGVGMGSIREVVQQIGGTINVSSKNYQGVKYHISIPLMNKDDVIIINDHDILENLSLQAERLLTKSKKKSTLSSAWYIEESIFKEDSLLDLSVYIKVSGNLDHHIIVSVDENMLYMLLNLYKEKENRRSHVRWMNEVLYKFAEKMVTQSIETLSCDNLTLEMKLIKIADEQLLKQVFYSNETLVADYHDNESQIRVFNLKNQLRLS